MAEARDIVGACTTHFISVTPVNMVIFLIFIGIMWVMNLSWEFQVGFGNYLKHTHPKSWVRIFWWSMCDVEGSCPLCDKHNTTK